MLLPRLIFFYWSLLVIVVWTVLLLLMLLVLALTQVSWLLFPIIREFVRNCPFDNQFGEVMETCIVCRGSVLFSPLSFSLSVVHILSLPVEWPGSECLGRDDLTSRFRGGSLIQMWIWCHWGGGRSQRWPHNLKCVPQRAMRSCSTHPPSRTPSLMLTVSHHYAQKFLWLNTHTYTHTLLIYCRRQSFHRSKWF